MGLHLGSMASKAFFSIYVDAWGKNLVNINLIQKKVPISHWETILAFKMAIEFTSPQRSRFRLWQQQYFIHLYKFKISDQANKREGKRLSDK